MLRKLKNVLHHKEAFSLVELMISLGIFAILIMMVTNLIILNLRVAKRVKARTYVREESSFMLKIMKKDIRNSDAIATTANPNELIITIDDPLGGSKRYQWIISNGVMTRTEVDEFDIPTGEGITYKTPADITFDTWESMDIFSVFNFDDNRVVVVRVRARDPNGMPEGQWMRKEVAVSTRNFQFS